MSDYTIKLTPSQLRAIAADIDNNAAIVAKEVSAIGLDVNQLRPSFLGNAASTFYKEFDSAVNIMDKWDDIVRAFAEEIREAANKLEAADHI